MRKIVGSGMTALAVLAFLLPGFASAQGVFLGAGGTFPTGDYGNYAKTGWQVEAGITHPLGEDGLQAFLEGMYGSNSHSDIPGDKTNLVGGFGGVEYSLHQPGEAGPFIFGEIGFLKHDFKSDEFSQYDESNTGFAFGGGVGYSIPLGGLNGWILGRYLQGQFDGPDGNTALFGVSAGLSISWGGS